MVFRMLIDIFTELLYFIDTFNSKFAFSRFVQLESCYGNDREKKVDELYKIALPKSLSAVNFLENF